MITTIGRKIMIWLVITWVGLGLVQLWAANRLATQGETLEKLQLVTLATEVDNRQLQNQIATLGSLQRIASESARLGLTEASRLEYLEAPSALALQDRP